MTEFRKSLELIYSVLVLFHLGAKKHHYRLIVRQISWLRIFSSYTLFVLFHSSVFGKNIDKRCLFYSFRKQWKCSLLVVVVSPFACLDCRRRTIDVWEIAEHNDAPLGFGQILTQPHQFDRPIADARQQHPQWSTIGIDSVHGTVQEMGQTQCRWKGGLFNVHF